MITVKQKGSFRSTDNFLKKVLKLDLRSILEKYGREGVSALSAATPLDTGKTADSWNYEITGGNGTYTICWTNSNVNDHVSIALILQYGHGTRNGGYVQGRDYINPALRPIFDKIAENVWKEVTSL